MLARVNRGTDLEGLIEASGVGRVYAGSSVNELKGLAEELADDEALRRTMSDRGKRLGRSMFSPEPEAAAKQIVV